MTIKRCYPVLVGASVAENQLCNGESVTVPNGHKYYLKKSGAESLGVSTGTAIIGLTSGSDMVIDLFILLPSSIADYAYTLEQETVGSGIAWLRSYGFLGGYVPYNAGSIESVEVTEKKCVGFNQWDEEWENGYYNRTTGAKAGNTDTSYIRSKNPIPCMPSTRYYFKPPVVHAQNSTYYAVLFYDADNNYIGNEVVSYNASLTSVTPNNARYLTFYCEIGTSGSTYQNDICINLSSDRNGEYEPYKSTSYDLGDDTLRGIFKLDANNNLYADGDRKTADGTITRYYGTRAYQEGDESLADAITDGTTTVYKLSSPTTEISTPFTSPQIVYPDGTEEFVTETDVPVGHETKYQL